MASSVRLGYERAQVLITVKTYPNPSTRYDETVCVAGVRVDKGIPEWIRLYPVRFRTVEELARFAKYDLIEVDVLKHGSADPRIESHRPDQSSIRLLKHLDTKNDWFDRRELIGGLRGATTTCDLIEAATLGPMNQPAPSLGMIKPDITEVRVTAGKAWTGEQLSKIEAASQPDLFGEGLKPLEAMPYQVQYRYDCQKSGCNGHKQKILDWEVGEAGRRWIREYGPDAIEKVRQRWQTDITASDRDLHLFVGNQHQHRGSFSILGTWWPRKTEEQISLFYP